MKVLFVQSIESDYGQDILWSGLVEREDIDLYSTPFHPGHAFPTRRYPKNLGYAGLAGFMQEIKSVPWKSIDVVVLGSAKPDVLRSYEKALLRLPADVTRIFVDGGDWPAVGGDFHRLHAGAEWESLQKRKPFDLVLKRDLIISEKYASNVRPLPFGFNLNRRPQRLPAEKKYQVSFWAVESHAIRTEALRKMAGLFDCATNGTTLNQTFSKYKRRGEKYLQELSACKICLNFRGAGWDTLRYWEAPAVSAFLISQKPQIEIPNPFTHGENIVYCKDDLSDLVELCEYYLKNETERELIAKNARAHLERFHTQRSRADLMLREIRKVRA